MKSIRRKVAHMTTVHRRFDTRIFLKECSTLSAYGYDVFQIVADGLGNEEKNGVKIIDIGRSKGRLDRMMNAPKRLLPVALSLNADIYHFHDPELFSVGVKLKKSGKKVIFDMHEDLPKQILSKTYLNWVARRILSTALALYERRVCKMFDYVIAATPSIHEKCQHLSVNAININNYPLLDELDSSNSDWKSKSAQVCYVGGITRIRGILEIINAIDITNHNVRLILGGDFDSKDLESAASSLSGWKCVDALGFIDRKRMSDVLSSSMAGLVTFLPAPNHIDAQPNKMFEYMSAGVPVIASNFPLWREIIETNDCGFCVDPESPSEIAKAIDYLVSHPDEAERMGNNGKKSVLNCYNWDIEKQKLLSVYQRLCD